jgi:hypothetical protein
MIPDDPKPLPPATLELLRAERGALFAPDDARSRVRERLAPAFQRGGGSGGAGPRGQGSPPRRLLGSVARPLSLGLTLLVGAAIGGALSSALQVPKRELIYVDRPVLVPVGVPGAPAVPESAPAPLVPAAAPRVEGAPSAKPDAELAAERAILDIARTALARGNGADALAATSKHEKRYPSGALGEEREAMAIQALVLLQRYDEARARGARFHQRFSGSVLAPAIDAALGAIP